MDGQEPQSHCFADLGNDFVLIDVASGQSLFDFLGHGARCFGFVILEGTFGRTTCVELAMTVCAAPSLGFGGVSTRRGFVGGRVSEHQIHQVLGQLGH
jgi:hypothetical protein